MAVLTPTPPPRFSTIPVSKQHVRVVSVNWHHAFWQCPFFFQEVRLCGTVELKLEDAPTFEQGDGDLGIWRCPWSECAMLICGPCTVWRADNIYVHTTLRCTS